MDLGDDDIQQRAEAGRREVEAIDPETRVKLW
jgi:hypothetical protein